MHTCMLTWYFTMHFIQVCLGILISVHIVLIPIAGFHFVKEAGRIF